MSRSKGGRIRNDHQFHCDSLSSKTVEAFLAYYCHQSKSDVLMLILKLKEVELYQRFFLDAGLGIWEEWDEEATFLDLEDLEKLDLMEEHDLRGKVVVSICCHGSYEDMSFLEFTFEDQRLFLRPSTFSDLDFESLLVKEI